MAAKGSSESTKNDIACFITNLETERTVISPTIAMEQSEAGSQQRKSFSYASFLRELDAEIAEFKMQAMNDDLMPLPNERTLERNRRDGSILPDIMEGSDELTLEMDQATSMVKDDDVDFQDTIDVDEGKAKILLICLKDSHPFETRTISLVPIERYKVGRVMAKSRPSAWNAIFDCKVLSRNHAMLWYTENGKFWITDTNSCNGTFINDVKLGKEEAELHFGDVVKFGVNVIEKSRDEVHGCIIASVQLYLPDGEEALPNNLLSPPFSAESPLTYTDLHNIYANMQESTQRSKVLKSKLLTIQNLLDATNKKTLISWEAVLNEDQLFHRLQSLEAKIKILEKDIPDSTLKDEVKKLKDDKMALQRTAKEAVRNVHTERCQTLKKVLKLETDLVTSRIERKKLIQQAGKIKETMQCLSGGLQVLENVYTDYRAYVQRKQLTTQIEFNERIAELNNSLKQREDDYESLQKCIEKVQRKVSSRIETSFYRRPSTEDDNEGSEDNGGEEIDSDDSDLDDITDSSYSSNSSNNSNNSSDSVENNKNIEQFHNIQNINAIKEEERNTIEDGNIFNTKFSPPQFLPNSDAFDRRQQSDKEYYTSDSTGNFLTRCISLKIKLQSIKSRFSGLKNEETDLLKNEMNKKQSEYGNDNINDGITKYKQIKKTKIEFVNKNELHGNDLKKMTVKLLNEAYKELFQNFVKLEVEGIEQIQAEVGTEAFDAKQSSSIEEKNKNKEEFSLDYNFPLKANEEKLEKKTNTDAELQIQIQKELHQKLQTEIDELTTKLNDKKLQSEQAFEALQIQCDDYKSKYNDILKLNESLRLEKMTLLKKRNEMNSIKINNQNNSNSHNNHDNNNRALSKKSTAVKCCGTISIQVVDAAVNTTISGNVKKLLTASEARIAFQRAKRFRLMAISSRALEREEELDILKKALQYAQLRKIRLRDEIENVQHQEQICKNNHAELMGMIVPMAVLLFGIILYLLHANF